jgi:hypothetical protein
MRKITICILLIFLIKYINAQENDSLVTVKQRNFSITTGYSQLRMLDKQVSPLMYRGDIVPLEIGYCVQSNKTYYGINAYLIPLFGVIKNVRHNELVYNQTLPNDEGVIGNKSFKNNYSAIFQEDISIWYQRKLRTNSTKKLDIYIGGEFKHYLNLSFTPSAVFMMHELSLNPKITFFKNLNKTSNFTSSFSFPLTGIMVRLPYANDPADGKHGNFLSTYIMGSEFFTPLSYQRVNFDFCYKKQFSEKWSIALSYRFDWFHYSEKRGITAYENKILVSFIKKLKSK